MANITEKELARFDESLPWRTRLEEGDTSLVGLENDLKAALRKCTAKQKRFVTLVTNGATNAKAYMDAGYRSKNTNCANVGANRLLSKSNIVDAIRLANALYQLKHGISARWKRQQLVDLYAKCSEVGSAEWNPTGANKALQLLMAIDGDGMSSIGNGSNSGVNVTIITGLPERETNVIEHQTGTIEHDKD